MSEVSARERRRYSLHARADGSGEMGTQTSAMGVRGGRGEHSETRVVGRRLVMWRSGRGGFVARGTNVGVVVEVEDGETMKSAARGGTLDHRR